MNKSLLICSILIISISSSVALLTLGAFPGWAWMESDSKDIIIARCINTPPDNSASNDSSFFSDIEVVSVLKGTNGIGPKRLRSLYRPNQGRYYLIFATYHDGHYQALEEFRIVPLEYRYSPAMIANKPLNEQVKKLISYRLDSLDLHMKEEADEKQRLEQALQ